MYTCTSSCFNPLGRIVYYLFQDSTSFSILFTFWFIKKYSWTPLFQGCLENSDLENSDPRPEKTQTLGCLENSDPEKTQTRKTQTLGCLKLRPRKNSDPKNKT